jgi:hypothetical protein
MTKRFQILIVWMASAAGPMVLADDQPLQKVMVLGAGTTVEEAMDRENPEGISRYGANFQKVIATTFVNPKETTLEKAAGTGADFLYQGVPNHLGTLTDREHGELLPLVGKHIDTLYAHSLGTLTVLRAIQQHVILAPKHLVIVDPPDITIAQGNKWKDLVHQYPDLKMDIYVGINDWFYYQRQRDADFQRGLGDPMSSEHPELAKQILSPAEAIIPYIDPRSGPASNISIKLFPGTHNLCDFLTFASRQKIDGLTDPMKSELGPTGDSVLCSSVSYPEILNNYLLYLGPYLHAGQKAANKYMKGKLPPVENAYAVNISDEAIAQNIKDAENMAKEAAWEYMKTLLEDICHSPDSIEHLYEMGMVPPINFDKTGLNALYSDDQDLTDCQKSLIEIIRNADGPVDIEELIQSSKAYQEEHRRPVIPLDKYFAAVGNFLGSVVSSFREGWNEPTDYSSSDSSSSSGSSGSSSGQQGYNHPNINGPAYGQAQGISSGGKSFDGN